LTDDKTSNAPPFASVLIIGMGLIGSSIAAALKAQADPPAVRGINRSQKAISEALKLGYLDQGAVFDEQLVAGWLTDQATQLIILAVPVQCAAEWFKRIEASGYSGAITDVASTKGVITAIAAQTLSRPERYIPGHPMAGSEVNGIEGARANLFSGTHWILCPDENTNPEVFTRLHEFVTLLGARGISLPREEHDSAIAIVSHVPHIVASALVQLAGANAGQNNEIFRLAAGGFKDTTRIAAGSPELWSGIALDNREAVAQGLSQFKQIVTGFEQSIARQNASDLTAKLQSAAQLRKSIPSTWVPDSSRLVELRIPMANHSGVVAQVTSLAGKVGCNIQSISIDHINEQTAILELILTDEGDIAGLQTMLISDGFDVALRPLTPQE
jgi:prephenate dehydrogenase